MKTNPRPGFYPPFEEKLNVISHGFGFVMSILGLFLLIYKAMGKGDLLHLISYIVFGTSLIMLYAASTFYHSAKKPLLRYRLNILDHASIYILIAGTYTPFALVILNGVVGWTIFAVVWTMALTGVILKLFYTGKYNLLSTAMYVIMGWIIVFALKPLINNLDLPGLIWLFAGGISYTLGAVFFIIDRIKLNHAIFHVFVLLGSFCHFISIYFYVLPD